MRRSRRRPTRVIASPSASCCSRSLSGLAGAGLWLARAPRDAASPRRVSRFAAALAALSLVVAAARRLRPLRRPGRARSTRATTRFTTTTNEPTSNLNQRLFTFSGSYRAELWHAAWHDYQAHPVLGSGARDLRVVLEPSTARSSTRSATRTTSTSRCSPRPARSVSCSSSSLSARRSLPRSGAPAIRSSRSRSRRSSPSSSTRPSTGTGRCRRSR